MFFPPVHLQMVAPPSLTPRCGACGLYKTCRTPKMSPSGKGRRRVLIVGEAPGKDEDREGTQLVGKSGRFLQRALRSFGVEMRRDCWLTNALICRPPGNKITDKKAYTYCRPNLLRAIEKYQPDVIIPLGFVATRSLVEVAWGSGSDIGDMSRWVGWRIPAQKFNAWICPTWHPAFLIREENKVMDAYFTRHLRDAFALEGKPFEEVPDYASQVRLLYDEQEIISFIENITDGVIAFDYEANMLKPESDKAWLVSCSICHNGTATVAFPMLLKVYKPLRRLLADKNVQKIASNMKYEDRWTRKVLGVQVRGWNWDTMLAAHLLDNRRHITSIKFQAFVQLGQPKYDTHIEPYLQTNEGGNSINKVDQVPLDSLLLYNGLDSLLEYLVADKQREQMGLRPLSDFAE